MTYDRELLLHGPLRHEELSLDQVQGYGRDAFGDPEALRLYGMAPSDWYERGVRVCGRTAVIADPVQVHDLADPVAVVEP